MNISTKFDIRQGVFFVKRKDTKHRTKCRVCQGQGNINIENYGSAKCPNECRDGQVYDYTEAEWYVGGNMIVQCINIQLLVLDEGTRYRAHYSDHCHDHGEHHLFASKTEAEAWCALSNKEPMGSDVFHGKDMFLEEPAHD